MLKYFKFFLVISSIVLVLRAVPVGALGKGEVLLQTDKLLVQAVKETRGYQKIQFTHLDTYEVEFLESQEVDGEMLYTATLPDGEQVRIQRLDNKVYVGGEVVAEISETLGEEDVLKIPRGWKALSTFKVSSAINSTNVSIVVGAFAAVLTLNPGVGFLVGFATTSLSMGLKTVYFTKQQYYSTTVTGLAKNDYTMYKYSNYTSKIGSGSYQFYYSQS